MVNSTNTLFDLNSTNNADKYGKICQDFILLVMWQSHLMTWWEYTNIITISLTNAEIHKHCHDITDYMIDDNSVTLSERHLQTDGDSKKKKKAKHIKKLERHPSTKAFKFEWQSYNQCFLWYQTLLQKNHTYLKRVDHSVNIMHDQSDLPPKHPPQPGNTPGWWWW